MSYPTKINAAGIEVVDTSDGAWAAYVAEGRDQLTRAEAEQAEVRHKLEIIKSEGLHDINSIRYEPEILAEARVMHNQNPSGQSVAELIEVHVVPIRQKYLEQFDSPAPVAARKAGANEEAFLKLLGGK